MNKNRVTLICEQCGKEYEVKQSKKNKSKFCSIECKNLALISKGTLTCKNCGKLYEVHTSELTRSRFCSLKCRNEYNKPGEEKEYVCRLCGDTFLSKRKREFCSIKCERMANEDISYMESITYFNKTIQKETVNMVKNKIKLRCKQCDKEYEVPKSKAEISKYCSVECRSEARRNTKFKLCPICGKQFLSDNSKPTSFEFCSSECEKRSLETNITITCKNCNKQYVQEYYEPNARCLCSSECYEGNRKKRLEHFCSYCGKKYTVSIYRSDISKYCSRECKQKAETKRVKLICNGCGNEYEVPFTRKDTSKYCSALCKHRYGNKIEELEYICRWCRKPFLSKHPMEYCSVKCTNTAINALNIKGIKDIYPNRGPGEEVRKCAMCGKRYIGRLECCDAICHENSYLENNELFKIIEQSIRRCMREDMAREKEKEN